MSRISIDLQLQFYNIISNIYNFLSQCSSLFLITKLNAIKNFICFRCSIKLIYWTRNVYIRHQAITNIPNTKCIDGTDKITKGKRATAICIHLMILSVNNIVSKNRKIYIKPSDIWPPTKQTYKCFFVHTMGIQHWL